MKRDKFINPRKIRNNMAKIIQPYRPCTGWQEPENKTLYKNVYTLDPDAEKGKDYITTEIGTNTFISPVNNLQQVYEVKNHTDKEIFLKKVSRNLKKKVLAKRDEVIGIKTEIGLHEFNEASKDLDLEERV